MTGGDDTEAVDVAVVNVVEIHLSFLFVCLCKWLGFTQRSGVEKTR